MLLCFAIGLFGLFAAGGIYQFFGCRSDQIRFAPPGKLLDVGGTVLHLHQQGSGGPVVVLEAGIAATSIGWALVQPEIANFTTVCSYDRAGLGWSGGQQTRRTVDQMTAELAGLLRASGLAGPFILVGHSFGGLLIKAFTLRYPELVAGLVFLDPVSLAAWSSCGELQRRRLALGVRLSRRGAMLARFGVVRLALSLLMSGGERVSKTIGRTAAGRGSAVLERIVGEVRKLPPEVWPAIRSHWSQPKSFLGMAGYLECLPACAAELVSLQLPRDLPVVILSAGSATAEELAERESMIAANPLGRHVVLTGSGHWLQLERPKEVTSAVLECVRRERTHERTSSTS